MLNLTIAQTRSNDPEVHAKGCADIKRGLRNGKYQSSYDIEVERVQDAAEVHWADIIAENDACDQDGMTRDDAQACTKYLPCTRH